MLVMRFGTDARSNMAALLLAALIPGPALAVPPPREQLTADCLHPQYASDQLVCDTPELLELDRSMRALLETTSIPTTSRWIEPQEQWLRRRSMCAMQREHASCVRAAYNDRIALLQASRMPPAPDRTTLAGDDAQVTSMAPGDAAHVFYDAAGQITAYARSGLPLAPGWQNFAQFSRHGNIIKLTVPDGLVLACWVASAHKDLK
ncbi:MULTISPECIES: hypothetical protein [unclassified Novosphingobium]|uniref:hypothetical protein n=1 Tax=unclassified Novosphingobium TaxID=2644732 RepID=UPI00135CF56D|nr:MULTISPECIES: hypothetical protein [unclassified Novosphingobium]